MNKEAIWIAPRRGNKSKSGLKHMAAALEFHCPVKEKALAFDNPDGDS